MREIRQITELSSLDVTRIGGVAAAWRTTFLEIARDKLIRGQIVHWYTFVDEFLNVALCHYFFGRRRGFINLWRTKRFQNFNYFILESLSLLEKLSFVLAIHKVPKRVAEDIRKLNAVRNGLAHALFPQNLKRNRPTYKGQDAFSVEGMRLLEADFDGIRAYFLRIADWAA